MQQSQMHQILDVAGVMFFEQGFWNAKISEIAARSETSTASIYKEFKSKDGLFKAVLARRLDQLKTQAQPKACMHDPVSHLLHVARRYQALCETDFLRDLIRVPMERNRIPVTLRRTMRRQIRLALERLCLPALEACAAQGLLDPARVTPALQLLSACIEHPTMWQNMLMQPGAQAGSSGVRLADEAVRITLAAYPPVAGDGLAPFSCAFPAVPGIPLGPQPGPMGLAHHRQSPPDALPNRVPL